MTEPKSPPVVDEIIWDPSQDLTQLPVEEEEVD